MLPRTISARCIQEAPRRGPAIVKIKPRRNGAKFKNGYSNYLFGTNGINRSDAYAHASPLRGSGGAYTLASLLRGSGGACTQASLLRGSGVLVSL